MRIGVVGSRSITEYEVVANAIINSPWFNQPYDPNAWNEDSYSFVSGGADGVDTSAEQFAERHGFGIDVKEPDWNDWSGEHPAKARNTDIVEAANVVIAVWDGSSNGTRDSIDKALDRGVPLYVEVVDNG